jgi:hypothetical protein
MIRRLAIPFGLFLTGVFMTLAASDESFGQSKAGTPTQKKADKAAKAVEQKAKETVKQEINGREAELLRNAYILLDTANANYDGHKGKAMKEVKEACAILDKQILAKGTLNQKAETLRQDAVTAYVKENRKLAGKETEAQVISDAQLYQAGQLLNQLRVVAAERKQERILNHLDKALKQIKLALETR